MWRELKNHAGDCYFCMINVECYNAKRKKSIVYPNITSDIRPAAYDEIPRSYNDENYTESDNSCPRDDSAPKMFDHLMS